SLSPRYEAADRQRVYKEDEGVHDRAVLHVAARRLPARIEVRADADGGPQRRGRRARYPSLLVAGLRVHAVGRESDTAREGLLDRQDGGRTRDDRGCRLV